MKKYTIWFWQRMITPHVAHLAKALATRGHNVVYLAEEALSQERRDLGWSSPGFSDVKLHFLCDPQAARYWAKEAPYHAIHVVQGLRSNGHISLAQEELKRLRRRQFVFIETIDTRGPRGVLKGPLYSWHLNRLDPSDTRVLAIGADTTTWLRRLARRDVVIAPFAYFLPPHPHNSTSESGRKFRFLFVGALSHRKRVDLMLCALARLTSLEFEVEIVGDGDLMRELEELADRILPGRVSFLGVQPMERIPSHLLGADCLVLPSSHDGWGAVVSEAIMAGTPAICSTACGVKGVVEASGEGGVFTANDATSLERSLKKILVRGKLTPERRNKLATWGGCLGAMAGAQYLEDLIYCDIEGMELPSPPWMGASEGRCVVPTTPNSVRF